MRLDCFYRLCCSVITHIFSFLCSAMNPAVEMTGHVFDDPSSGIKLLLTRPDLSLNERKQVCIDLVLVRLGYAMRIAGIDSVNSVLTIFDERIAVALIGTTWSSSPCMISVGMSNFFRSSVKSASESP